MFAPHFISGVKNFSFEILLGYRLFAIGHLPLNANHHQPSLHTYPTKPASSTRPARATPCSTIKPAFPKSLPAQPNHNRAAHLTLSPLRAMPCDCTHYPPIELDRQNISRRIKQSPQIRKRLTQIAEHSELRLFLFRCPECGQLWQSGHE